MKKGTMILGAVAAFMLMAGTGAAFAQETADSLLQKGMMAFADDNHTEAFAYFQKAAQLGDAHSEVLVANCLLAGNGVQKDDILAVIWLQKAAEQGSAEARAELGVFYVQGKFVAQDKAQGKRLLQSAALQNNPRAKYYLTLCNEKVVNESQDTVLAEK